jgi:hypothetical protein
MAERDNFSLQNMMDDIPAISSDELPASEIEAFFNGDSEELEPVKVEKEQAPSKKPQSKKEEVEIVQTKSKDEELVDDFFGKDEDDNEPILGVKKKEESEEIDTSSEEDSEGESEVNRFQELAQEFVDLGILSLDEDEELNIASGEELASRLEKEHKKSAANIIEKFLGRFGEDYKEAFDAIFVKGVNPKEFFQTASQIYEFENMDMTEVENQRLVFRQHYKNLGLDESRIESKLQKAEDYGDLEDDARDFHKVLVQKEKDKKEQLLYKQEQDNKRKLAQKQHYVQSVNQILSAKLQSKDFDGIPVDANTARETFAFLTEDRYQTPDGEILTEFDKYFLDLKKPENYEKRVKLAILAQLIETDPTLSKIQKKAITKESNKLFGRVIKHTDKQKTPQQRKIEEDKITSFI